MPEERPDHPIVRGLARWVRGVAERPRLTLALAAASAAVLGLYAAQTLRMNSDNSTLVRQDAPFRVHYRTYLDRFPELEETTLIVLESDSIDRVEDAVDRMRAALEARPDLVRSVYAPGADAFYEDHGFLYLDVDALDTAITRLAEAQPALLTLAGDPSLRGLFDELAKGLEHRDAPERLPVGFERLAVRLSGLGDDLAAGRPHAFAWADEFVGEDGPVYRLVSVQGRAEFGEVVSSEHLIEQLRAIGAELGLKGPPTDGGVRMRLTGFVPLAHEELVSMREGIELALALSLALLVAILGFGVRSIVIITGTFAALGASLVWTTAWAAVSVGELNTISAAFAVLLVGLGVDFGVHFGLRYEEETSRGTPVPDALVTAARGVGSALVLCALTSAIGFLAFVPTEYRGLAALGVIAGGGMFLSLAATFTVMPAVLALLPPPRPRRRPLGSGSSRFFAGISRHAGAVVGVSALLAAGAALLATQIRFDWSTLALKDPSSESMQTLADLQAEGILTDYSATVLAPDRASSADLVARLEAQPPVREARGPDDALPEDQDEKLEMLLDAALFLDPVFRHAAPVPPPTPEERVASARALRDRIAEETAALPDAPGLEPARRLGESLDRWLAGEDPGGQLARLETLVLGELPERLDWLARAVSVGPVGFDDLPVETRRRLIAPDGSARVVAIPEEDLSEVAALDRFVDAVSEVDPAATGRPVVEAGIGRIVVDAFQRAIAIAFVCVALLLALTLRSLLDALFVLAPITLAALFTIAVGILVDTPFNMANVIAIPLVLGLGIDNGIHIFMRARHDGSLASAMGSSTPRAVLLSALTTLAAFASLSLSPHRGIASLGLLLSISILCLVYCTVVVLPAMIELRARAGDRAGSARRPVPEV